MAAVYFLGGGLAGVIAGALARLAVNWLGAGLVGVVALFPILLAVTAADYSWQKADLETSLVVSIVLGFPLGVIYRHIILTVDPFGPIE
jgi:prepilin signal peptidase PulO-like enzyme (type II secretory pathway)